MRRPCCRPPLRVHQQRPGGTAGCQPHQHHCPWSPGTWQAAGLLQCLHSGQTTRADQTTRHGHCMVADTCIGTLRCCCHAGCVACSMSFASMSRLALCHAPNNAQIMPMSQQHAKVMIGLAHHASMLVTPRSMRQPLDVLNCANQADAADVQWLHASRSRCCSPTRWGRPMLKGAMRPACQSCITLPVAGHAATATLST